jgi:hypothetical protein
MEKLNLSKINLRKFGITMGMVFLAITVFILIKHRHSIWPTFAVTLLLFIISFLAPDLLKIIYILWMKFAFALSWINTRIILLIIFYLIFSPVGLAMRLFRVDSLDRKIEF